MNLLEPKNDICPHSFAYVNDQNKQTPKPACNGCQLWSIPYSEQLESKKNDLKNKLNTQIAIEVKTAGDRGHRTRFDFTVENQIMGLYSTEKQLIPLSTCWQLTPELKKAYDELKNRSFPFKKGSLRLRVSPENKWGLWLDLANTDIKQLLIEKNFLINLSKKFSIEIGQRKKTLDPNSFNSEQLKLTDPLPDIWFQALNQPMYCAISSFTQPGWKTGDLLIQTVLDWIAPESLRAQALYEYGSGIGPFTTQLLKAGVTVYAFENDSFAIECLKLNTQSFKDRLIVNSETSVPIPVALVNPPRSGLSGFTQVLLQKSPDKIIYVSCFPETLQKDVEALAEYYKIEKLTLVDQFPQTRHYEVCALLQRIN